MPPKNDVPMLLLPSAASFATWLATNATTSPGVWLTLAKKGTTSPTTITYAQAVDIALCQGWIDGQTRSLDAATYTQRFTPRTAKSAWSTRNVAKVARLEAEGLMQPAGRAAVDAAKADGRWEAAYAGQADMVPPQELVNAIEEAGVAAKTTWEGLSRKERYAICLRLHALKTDAGRQKRIKEDVERLAKGEGPRMQEEKRTKDAKAEQRPSKFVKVKVKTKANTTKSRSVEPKPENLKGSRPDVLAMRSRRSTRLRNSPTK